MQQHYQRSQLFIDESVQAAVLIRAGWYWIACLIAQMLMAVFFAVVNSTTGDAKFWWHLQLTVLAAFALLPIILFDLLKLSHRWVGPIFRVRQSLRALASGESLGHVYFRKHDFWQELANDLNKVSEELARHRQNATSAQSITAQSRRDDELTTPATFNDQSPIPTEAIVI